MNGARLTGVAVLLTAGVLFVGGTFSDPGMESGDDARAFGQEALDAAARSPGIVVAQAVQISLAMLAVLAGAGLWALADAATTLGLLCRRGLGDPPPRGFVHARATTICPRRGAWTVPSSVTKGRSARRAACLMRS